jgi:hypothetical protein
MCSTHELIRNGPSGDVLGQGSDQLQDAQRELLCPKFELFLIHGAQREASNAQMLNPKC